MSLIKNKTKWVLFLSSSAATEHRHILDLAFGLFCLESAGVKPADVFIYIDGADRSFVDQWLAHGSANSYVAKQSNDFFADQANNSHENMVMFVTGHGGISGIDAQTPITPYALLKCIKSAPNLKHAVLYLGQCYAGIFNYIGAGRKKVDAGSSEPELIIMGATNLHESISSPTQEILANGQMTWAANLFLLHIFKWISNPRDVDGDGKLTVIDSYKYAGAMSNMANKTIKMVSFRRSVDLHNQLILVKQALSNSPSTQSQLLLQAIEQQYSTLLDVSYVHQECWILNAIPAQFLEF
jgi:hypothetical protein